MPKKPSSGIDDLLRKGLITRGNSEALRLKWRETGIPRLDDAIGGGLPMERFSLITGHESAGKTLLTQIMAAQFQRTGGTVALVDAEISYDERWWAASGVDTEALIVGQPVSGEAAVDIVTALIGNVDLIIIDSLAALVAASVSEKSAEESNVAPIASVHQKLFYNMFSRLVGSGTAVVGINQLRNVIGGRPGADTTFPGGRAQRFYAHLRLEMNRAGWVVASGGQRTGVKYAIRVAKNKTGAEGAQIEVPFGFDGKFDYVSLVISDAIDKGSIVGRGAFYRFPRAVFSGDPEPFGLKAMEDGELELWQVMGRDGLTRIFSESEPALRALEQLVY